MSSSYPIESFDDQRTMQIVESVLADSPIDLSTTNRRAKTAPPAFPHTKLHSLPVEMLERILAELPGRDMRSCLAVPNAQFGGHCVAYVRHVHAVWLRALKWMDANDQRRKRICEGRHYLINLREMHAMLHPGRPRRKYNDSAAEHLVLEMGPVVRQYLTGLNPYTRLGSGEVTRRISALIRKSEKNPARELSDADLIDFLAYMLVLFEWLWDVGMPRDFDGYEPRTQFELSYCTLPYANIGDYCDSTTALMTVFTEKVCARLHETMTGGGGGASGVGGYEDGGVLGDGAIGGLLGRAYVRTQVQMRMRDAVTSTMFYCANSVALIQAVLPKFRNLQTVQVLNVHSFDFKVLAHYLNVRPSIRHVYLIGKLPDTPERPDGLEIGQLPELCFQHLDNLRLHQLSFLTPDYMRQLLFYLCRVRRVLMMNNLISAAEMHALVEESHATTDRLQLPRIILMPADTPFPDDFGRAFDGGYGRGHGQVRPIRRGRVLPDDRADGGADRDYDDDAAAAAAQANAEAIVEAVRRAQPPLRIRHRAQQLEPLLGPVLNERRRKIAEGLAARAQRLAERERARQANPHAMRTIRHNGDRLSRCHRIRACGQTVMFWSNSTLEIRAPSKSTKSKLSSTTKRRSKRRRPQHPHVTGSGTSPRLDGLAIAMAQMDFKQRTVLAAAVGDREVAGDKALYYSVL